MDFNCDYKNITTEDLAEIYEFFFPKIYNYIKFRVGDSNLTDDLTSQVFEKLLYKIYSFNHYKGNFSAWLFTIAHNTVVDHFRKQKNDPLVFLDYDNTKSIQPDTEDTLLSEEMQNTLFLALRELDDRARNIIGLKFWSGMTNRKIAEITGLSENNVGIIIYRSMQRLRDILCDLGVNSYE